MSTVAEENLLNSVSAPPSLREMAYKAIKEAIMSGTLKRGQIYTEQGLAAQLGISKTPVHEAILDLESKGFVTLVPRKGIKVNELTAEDIRHLYQFRSILETAALRQIGASLHDQDLAYLNLCHQKCIQATQAADHLEYIRWDRKWHLYIIGLTKNSYLLTSARNVRDLLDWMGVRAMYRPDRLAEVDLEHAAVMERLEDGDAEGAARRMEEHINATTRNALTGWEKGYPA